MINKKTRKLATVSVLLVSVLAGSVLAGAKTKTVQLKEGACYTLPKKAGSIVVKNKKVVKFLKTKKLKAVKKGKCKVTYVKKGKKYVLKVVVKRPDKNNIAKPTATPEVKPEPVATPVPTPSSTPTEKPKATPWGNVLNDVPNLVITKMEPGSNENETILYCDDLGDEYKYAEPNLYRIKTGKLVCTVLTSAAQKFNVGDYVLVEFRGVQHNSVTEKDDVTTITGLSDVFPYKPVKKDNVKPTPESDK